MHTKVLENPSAGARLQDESGATTAEYALVAAFIAAVIAGTVLFLGLEVVALFEVPWP